MVTTGLRVIRFNFRMELNVAKRRKYGLISLIIINNNYIQILLKQYIINVIDVSLFFVFFKDFQKIKMLCLRHDQLIIIKNENISTFGIHSLPYHCSLLFPNRRKFYCQTSNMRSYNSRASVEMDDEYHFARGLRMARCWRGQIFLFDYGRRAYLLNLLPGSNYKRKVCQRDKSSCGATLLWFQACHFEGR